MVAVRLARDAPPKAAGSWLQPLTELTLSARLRAPLLQSSDGARAPALVLGQHAEFGGAAVLKARASFPLGGESSGHLSLSLAL